MPANVELYDFVDGTYSMPMPDFSGDGSFLTSMCSVLIELDPSKEPSDPASVKRVLLFQYPSQMARSGDRNEHVLQFALKAIEQFDAKAQPILQGERWPKPLNLTISAAAETPT